MEMTLNNLKWADKPQVKKGNYGEKLVEEILKSQGFVLYKPFPDGAHVFDYMACKDGAFKFGVEVKTKPACRKYPETGFDYRHYERYKQNSAAMNLRVFIFFVDEIAKQIYGNYLDELDKPCEYQGMLYPKTRTKTGGKGLLRYYPLSAMIVLADISDKDAENIKKLYTGNYF